MKTDKTVLHKVINGNEKVLSIFIEQKHQEI